jgi:prepilin-type N-terminal cleavage/methylation domain-containing protein
MKHYAKAQRGFTLIEMSIVLVIIGLIIGGILKGQELIESSRQKNLVSQVDRVKASITTFLDRFKSYPGDYGRAVANLNAQLANGNEDGHVGATAANVAALVTGQNGVGENVQFWTHLLAADLIGGGTVIPAATAPTCFSGNCAAPSPLPSASYAQTGLSVLYGTHEGTAANVGSSKQAHWLVFSRWAGAAVWPTAAGASAISPERAFQLDSKYDDGIAWEGAIRTITTANASCGASATAYVPLNQTSADCNMVFEAE